MKKAEVAFTTAQNRASLFESGLATELQVTSLDHRERLLRTTEKSIENKQRLIQTRATLETTIDVAGEIMVELSDQRSRIEKMRDKLRGINDRMNQARDIMTRMARRLITNKLLVVLIILILLAVIFAVVYFRFFFGNGRGTRSEPAGDAY